MTQIPIKCILTHMNPDLDAILSILLLRRFGKTQFPGVQTAEIAFCAAGKLPQDKTAEELEKEGILAVDVGGGRLDAHPVGNQVNETKWERCASDLTAEAVHVINHPAWQALIEYTRQQDTTGQSIRSKDYIHHLATLPTILNGFQLLYSYDSNRLLREGMNVLEVIPLYMEHKESLKPQDTPDIQPLLKELTELYFINKGFAADSTQPALVTLLEWRRRLREAPETAFSSDPLDEMVSLPALLAGLWYHEKADQDRVAKTLHFWLDAIWEREKQWTHALEEFDQKGIVYRSRNANIVSIVSTNGMTIKAARFRARADLVIYRNSHSGATSILLNRRGPLNKFSMPNLAAKVRVAECMEEKSAPDYQRLHLPGMIHGWFLHPSENLLICGSPKTSDFVPSRIQIEDLTGIALTEVEWLNKMPSKYCPDDHCVGASCIFYPMHAPTCKKHPLPPQDPGIWIYACGYIHASFGSKNKTEEEIIVILR